MFGGFVPFEMFKGVYITHDIIVCCLQHTIYLLNIFCTFVYPTITTITFHTSSVISWIDWSNSSNEMDIVNDYRK